MIMMNKETKKERGEKKIRYRGQGEEGGGGRRGERAKIIRMCLYTLLIYFQGALNIVRYVLRQNTDINIQGTCSDLDLELEREHSMRVSGVFSALGCQIGHRRKG